MENSRIKAAPHDGISEGTNQSTRVPGLSMIGSGDHGHAASGACLLGSVKVGRKSHIGVGASCLQNISIGEECLIGGGAAGVGDIPDYSVASGVAARIVKRRKERVWRAS